MNLKEFVQKTHNKNEPYFTRPRIVCNDGFTMSVQGGTGIYCSPRLHQDWYDEMEIGFPSQEEPLINEFAEDNQDYTGTVYGYVSCSIIQEVIEKHGGINETETFKFVNHHLQ